MEQEFTVLENKIVGRNMYIHRKVRDKKASEVADFIGISESAYTKYERGESKITIDIVQKVAEFHKTDPLQLLMSQPGHIVENVHNSPFAIHGSVNTTDEKQTALIARLIETQIAMNEKIMALLEKK
jgi:transcriptional regulator with XRE-family HTH domain